MPGIEVTKRNILERLKIMDMRKGSGAALVSAFLHVFSAVPVKQATGMLILQGSESRTATNRHSRGGGNPVLQRSDLRPQPIKRAGFRAGSQGTFEMVKVPKTLSR